MPDSSSAFTKLEPMKLLSQLRLPTTEFDTILASQRKNIEALTKANQLAVEGLQAVARRQVDILRGAVEEATQLTRGILGADTTEGRVAKQTEAAKLILNRTIENLRELAEILSKAGNEALDVVGKRVGENLDEIRDLVTRANAHK